MQHNVRVVSAGRAPCHAMPRHATPRHARPSPYSTTTRVKPAAGRWLADASGRLRAGVPVPRGWRRPWWLVEADSMLHAAYVAFLHCLFNCEEEELIRTCIRHHSRAVSAVLRCIRVHIYTAYFTYDVIYIYIYTCEAPIPCRCSARPHVCSMHLSHPLAEPAAAGTGRPAAGALSVRRRSGERPASVGAWEEPA